jgi:outer membrane protein TolC
MPRGAAVLLLALALCAGRAGAVDAGIPNPLSLSEALRIASQGHPQVAASAARLGVSEAEFALVEAADDANLALDLALRGIKPSHRIKDVDDTNDDSWVVLRLEKQLYDFGRQEAREQAAAAQLEESRWQLLGARQQHLLDLVRAFAEVAVADHENAELNETLAIAYIEMDRAQNRLELGQRSDIEVMALQADYQQVRALLVRNQGRQRLARLRLAQALNRPDDLPDRLSEPELAQLQREVGDFDQFAASALEDNPELQAMRQRVNSALASLQAAEAADNPTISAGLEGAGYSRVLASTNPFEASLMVHVPLYRGQRTDAEVAKYRMLSTQYRAELELARQQVRERLLALWTELNHRYAERESLRVSADYRELYFDRSRALYEMELKSDLGDSMAHMTRVRRQVEENRYGILLAWLEREALAGNLTDETLQQWIR